MGSGGEGFPQEDVEYPGVRWVLASYILLFLEDGKPMPRCQDLPSKAFGSLRTATRVFAVTHPWLSRYHPDPQGIQMETLRAKLQKMKKQLMLDEVDVVFFDYMCLPQVDSSGKDDRTAAEKQRLRAALSGDLMGRIYLTARVIIIDEVPKDTESSTPYLDRGWCYFECMVASMNTFPRDLMWVTKEVKDQIAACRELSVQFRESGDLGPLLGTFDAEIGAKAFAAAADRSLVRGFFVSLATSQRLVAAAVRGDTEGVTLALEGKADPCSRNGQGRTPLQAACANNRIKIVVEILQRTDAMVAAMRTMENETCVDLAREGGARECEVLVRHKLGEAIAPIIVRSIEGDAQAVKRLLQPEPAQPATAEKDALDALSTVPGKPSPVSQEPAAKKAAAAKASTAALKSAPAAAKAPKAAAQKAKAAAKAPGGRSSPTLAKAKPSAPMARGSVMRSAGSLVLGAGSPTPMSPPPSPPPQTPPTKLEGSTKASAPKVAEGESQRPGQSPRESSCDTSASDDIGNTALHYAVSLGYAEVAEALLEARADLEAANGEGETPLALAKRMGHKQILALLPQET